MHTCRCGNCGIEFMTESKDRKYCSKKCANAARSKIMKEKTAMKIRRCQFCGKEFRQLNFEQFCSDECKEMSAIVNHHERKRNIVEPVQKAYKTLEFVHVSSISGNWRWVEHEYKS